MTELAKSWSDASDNLDASKVATGSSTLASSVVSDGNALGAFSTPPQESLITAPGPESDDDDWNKISMTSSNGGDGQSLSWHSEVVSRNQEEDDKSGADQHANAVKEEEQKDAHDRERLMEFLSVLFENHQAKLSKGNVFAQLWARENAAVEFIKNSHRDKGCKFCKDDGWRRLTEIEVVNFVKQLDPLHSFPSDVMKFWNDLHYTLKDKKVHGPAILRALCDLSRLHSSALRKLKEVPTDEFEEMTF